MLEEGLAFVLTVFEQREDLLAEVLDREWFLYISFAAAFESEELGVEVVFSCKEHHGDVGTVDIVLDLSAKLVAVHYGHHDVGDDKVIVVFLQLVERFLPVAARIDDKVLRELVGKEFAHIVVVLHQEQGVAMFGF